MSAVEGLRACPLFRGFTDTGLTIIASIATGRSFPRGAPLFVENMVGDSLFILTDGRIRLSAKNASNDEMTLCELSAPGYVGELALLQQGQRLCTATAIEPVTALELRHGDFQRLMQQKPQACIKLLMGLVASFGEKVLANRENLKSLLPKK